MNLNLLSQATWLGPENWVSYVTSRGIKAGFTGTTGELSGSFHHVKQVHGNLVVKASDATAPTVATRPEADGIWTEQAGLIVTVKTADCLPLLLWHPKLAMALHAGWRGFVGGILQNGLSLIKDRGISLAEVNLLVGPAISSYAFEIGPEVKEPIAKMVPWDFILSKGKDDRWHADLQMAAVAVAVSEGLAWKNVACVRSCTQYEVGRPWHSYRRDGARAGRNWSWVAL